MAGTGEWPAFWVAAAATLGCCVALAAGSFAVAVPSGLVALAAMVVCVRCGR